MQALHCEKCPYLEFFWSVLSHIRTRKTPNADTFYAVPEILIIALLVKTLVKFIDLQTEQNC